MGADMFVYTLGSHIGQSSQNGNIQGTFRKTKYDWKGISLMVSKWQGLLEDVTDEIWG